MLLLRLRVHSFTLAVFARAVNMNRYPCSTIATRRGKKGSETFIRLLRHVFLLNSFATSPPKLWSADTEISTNEKAPRESCRFPPEMGSKLHVRRNFVLFARLLHKFVFLREDGRFGRRSWSSGPRFHAIYAVKSELFRWKWNGSRSLQDFQEVECKETSRLCQRRNGFKEIEDWTVNWTSIIGRRGLQGKCRRQRSVL